MSYRSRFHCMYIKETRKTQWLEKIRPKFCGWDSNHLDCSLKHVAIPYQNSNGDGGCVAVFDFNKEGKFEKQNLDTKEINIIRAHTRAVTDCKFNPFNPRMLATCSEDCTIRMWSIPEGGIGCLGRDMNTGDSVRELFGHIKKVGNIGWHPTCENVLVSLSVDKTVRIWDVEVGVCKIDFPVPGYPLKFDFNGSGNTMVLVDRCKKMYLIDPRMKKITEEVSVFGSMKGIRVVYMKNKDMVVCTGFDRGASRKVKLFDIKNLSRGPVCSKELDLSAGINMLFYDNDLGFVYMGGKGEGLIRYFDTGNRSLHHLNSYQSNTAQRGLCMKNKLGLDTSSHELGRFYKLTNDSVIPLQVFQPRKSRSFQPDFYPDTDSLIPTGDADGFFYQQEKLTPLKKTSLDPEKREHFLNFWNNKIITPFNREEEERVDSIIDLFGEFKIPLANKDLNLWKCFLINSSEIFPGNCVDDVCEFEYRGLVDLNLNVEEKTILCIILGKISHHSSIHRSDSLLDYFIFFRRLGMKREMEEIVSIIRRIKSFSTLYKILVRLGKEQHENETIQRMFKKKKYEHSSTSKEVVEITIDTFDTSLGLAVFTQLKDRYSSEIEKNRDEVFLLEGFEVFQNHLEKYNKKVLDITKHKDFMDYPKQPFHLSSTIPFLFPKLYELLKNDEKLFLSTSNVTLVSTEGKEFPTHKEILVYRFGYFHSMFRSQWAEKESLDKERKVDILDMNNAVLETFLEYTYTNRVDQCSDFLVLIKLAAIGHKYLSPKLMYCALNRMDMMIIELQKHNTEDDGDGDAGFKVLNFLFGLISEVGDLLFFNEDLLNRYFIPRFIHWMNKSRVIVGGRPCMEEVFRIKVRESHESYQKVKEVEKLEVEKKELENRVRILEERIKLMELKKESND